MSSSSSTTTTTIRSHKSNAINKGSSSSSSGSSKDVDIDWIDIAVELTLRLGIAVTSGYLLMWISRRLFPPHLFDNDSDDVSSSSLQQSSSRASKSVHQRIAKILYKRQLRSSLSNTSNNTKKNNNAKNAIVDVPPLSAYERMMAEDIIDPDDIESSFMDVGGLDETKREIYELAVLPLLQPELFVGKLVQPCKGILLYGKPGTGKTMLAKALAKESESIFLPLQLSKILNKYWGESNKLIAAAFSLATKLQPAIIFIDELDTFLKNTSDQTAFMDSMKAEFLTLWDGIGTSSTSRVMVLGATNKPQSIDTAILRRMPRTFEIPLPDATGRLSILKLLTDDENLDDNARAFLPRIANMTVGYSGSDLKELCKAAAMVPVRERTSEFARRRVMGESLSILSTESEGNGGDNPNQDDQRTKLNKTLRPISEQDFMIALGKVKQSGRAAQEYGTATAREAAREQLAQNNNNSSTTSTPAIDANSIRQLATLLHALSSLSVQAGNANNGDDEDEKTDDIPRI